MKTSLIKNNKVTTLAWVTLFAIAMGLLEAAVVVYLRELIYNEKQLFPLQPLPGHLALTEVAREAATILMLAATGILAGKTARSRFAYFLISFAVWDIFYYVFLKVFINWPETLLDWDILFLIPVPWIGPVIAPCLVALLMIVLGLLLIRYEEKSPRRFFSLTEVALLCSGCLVILGSFMYDYYVKVIAEKGLTAATNALGSDDYFSALPAYIPQHFNWGIFFIGYALIITALLQYHLRHKRLNMVLF